MAIAEPTQPLAYREFGWVRPAVAVAGAVVAGVVAIVVSDDLAAVFGRAEPGWLALGIGAEAVSIAGYVALLALVAGLDLRSSYRITLGGAAVTRLLPTAGAGGLAFAAWALRRADRPGTLLPFLILLYAVFLIALAAGGLAVALSGRGDWALIPAGAALAAIGGGALLARRRAPAAFAIARGHDPRLLGAVVWWGFDLLVLWTTLTAVGAAPAASVLLLAYFLGAVGNTVPVPGAMSGGMIGVLVALGTAPAAAVAGVLAYRTIAVWLPLPFGAAALRRI